MNINNELTASRLLPKIERLWDLSGQKILQTEKTWDGSFGAPVFTVRGVYTSQSWTEWTQGFQFGSAILQFDATDDDSFLDIGRSNTVKFMAPHVSHVGVHDHGFNNVSTYGNLLRLMNEGRIEDNAWERDFYELALKGSGAIQASRWTELPEGLGYIYSFNGPHSLFADTIRTLRILGLSHQLGHVLMSEQDKKVSLFKRLLRHAETTARFNVYFGEERDFYDVRGRVAHESIFNINDGSYRCPNSQQGYSPFTTWTRGHAWVILGFAEQLEFLAALPERSFDGIVLGDLHNKETFLARFLQVAEAVADFYIDHTPADGIPYWDTGAPGLSKLGDYLERPADPFNEHEPVDSSAAVIAAQGLLRLGNYLKQTDQQRDGSRYWQAGLTIVNTIFDEPYLGGQSDHQGLIRHSIYRRPNLCDYIPAGGTIPFGESSMWGDYHARELAVYLQRVIQGQSYLRFFI